MIALVEGSERQKTPNEVALNILLLSLTAVFVLVVATLWPFMDYSGIEPSCWCWCTARLPHPDHHRRAL